MSIFNTVQAQCGACGQAVTLERSTSVNAARRPALRAEILDGSFQSETCPSCGDALRIPPQLTYLDMPGRLWLSVQPASAVLEWQRHESETWQKWRESYGDLAPAPAQELARSVRARLVFGWAALREKLLCDDLGVDDLVLELVKAAVLANVNDSPVSDQTELRLVGGDEQQLTLAWLHGPSEEVLSRLSLPRDAYDEVAASHEWQGLRERLTRGLLVDLQRLLVPGTGE